MGKRLSIVGTMLRDAQPRGEGRGDRRVRRATSCRCSPTSTIAPVVDAVVPLDRAADAYDLLASDATFGKVILDCR